MYSGLPLKKLKLLFTSFERQISYTYQLILPCFYGVKSSSCLLLVRSEHVNYQCADFILRLKLSGNEPGISLLMHQRHF